MPTAPDRLAPAILDMARRISTATLTSQLQKRGFGNTFMLGVLPLRPEMRLAGQACTLRFIPTREDLEPPGETDNRTSKQRLAVEAVGPGDVLVIDARGDVRAATLGDILAARIKQRGAAGIVTDGAFRDTPSIRGLDLATYAQGQNPYASSRIHHPQDVNVPIGCGGVAVVPGDLVVGDGEGVVVVPRAIAEEVVQAALEQDQRETFIMAKIRQGASILGVYPPDASTLAEYEEWKRKS
ncbi:MAG: ribonuclease activity regulator RraA [Chloroflexota bacterium]|nr:ribonuclease activity regulator RraA [Chloroflexota bacterium]